MIGKGKEEYKGSRGKAEDRKDSSPSNSLGKLAIYTALKLRISLNLPIRPMGKAGAIHH